MKEVIYNYNNLRESEIDEVVVRAKGLIINSKNEITLGYSHKTYQFPEGHLEKGETITECLMREIKKETGIELNDFSIKPFEKLTYYSKNYHDSGKNRKNEIYYFIVNTDKIGDLNKLKLDDYEKEGNFTLKSFPLPIVEQILINSIPDNEINGVIV